MKHLLLNLILFIVFNNVYAQKSLFSKKLGSLYMLDASDIYYSDTTIYSLSNKNLYKGCYEFNIFYIQNDTLNCAFDMYSPFLIDSTEYKAKDNIKKFLSTNTKKPLYYMGENFHEYEKRGIYIAEHIINKRTSIFIVCENKPLSQEIKIMFFVKKNKRYYLVKVDNLHNKENMIATMRPYTLDILSKDYLYYLLHDDLMGVSFVIFYKIDKKKILKDFKKRYISKSKKLM